MDQAVGRTNLSGLYEIADCMFCPRWECPSLSSFQIVSCLILNLSPVVPFWNWSTLSILNLSPVLPFWKLKHILHFEIVSCCSILKLKHFVHFEIVSCCSRLSLAIFKVVSLYPIFVSNFLSYTSLCLSQLSLLHIFPSVSDVFAQQIALRLCSLLSYRNESYVSDPESPGCQLIWLSWIRIQRCGSSTVAKNLLYLIEPNTKKIQRLWRHWLISILIRMTWLLYIRICTSNEWMQIWNIAKRHIGSEFLV